MLGLEGLSLPIVCTIIVVTMATWFLCCWRKKDAVSVTDGKTAKGKQASVNGSKKEKPDTPSPSEEKPDNGAVSQSSGSAPQPTADVGDFSVVQRETEILRSYRKAAPPKNRARQSRAPRAMNRSTENLDIFTELSEDELKSSDENEDNTANGLTTTDDSTDHHISDETETDGVKFRMSTEHDSGKRETRSSMLADIEKTLARLHSTEDSQDENTDKPDDMIQDKEAGRSSTLNTETHSEQSSPSSKPKAAPKVSPKPIPRKRNTGPKTPESNSQIQDNESTKESSDTTSDHISDQMASSQAVTTLAIQLNKSSDANVDSRESTPTTSTVIKASTADKPSDNGLSDTIECAGSLQEGTGEAPQVNTEAEESTESSPVKTSISFEHMSTSADEVQSTDNKEPAEVPTSSMTSDIKPEHHNESESNETEPTADDNVANIQEIPEADQESTGQEVDKTEDPRSTDSDDPQLQCNQESRTESEQMDNNVKKTDDTADDQTNKGKISKIPIRAGFKKGSSPTLDKVPNTQ